MEEAEQLKEALESQRQAMESQKQEYESKILRMMLDHSVETALIRSGARNIKAAKALIREEELEIVDNSSVRGIQEQINALKGDKETAFLFKEEAAPNPPVPGESTGTATQPQGLTYEGYCALYNN